MEPYYNKYRLLADKSWTLYHNSTNKYEWSLSRTEIENIICTVNSNHYFRFLVLQKYNDLSAKNIKKLTKRRNKMVMDRVKSKMEIKREQIINDNKPNLMLYKKQV